MGKKTTATKAKKTAKAARKATPKKKASAKKPAAAKKTPVKKKSAGKSVKKPSKKSNSKTGKTTTRKPVSKPAKKLPAKSKPAAKSTQKTTARSKVAKTPVATKGDAKSATKAGTKPAPKADATKKSTVTKSSTKSPGTKTPAGGSKATARTQAARGSAKAFTLEDVLGEIERSSKTRKTPSKSSAAAVESKVVAPKKALPEPKPKQQKFGAASLADILGYNPTKNEKPVDEIEQIPKKFIRFYKLLIQLRDHVNSGLTLHSEDTLKRSNREDSGDLSGYGQHMADAGTDNFDRDFALSLVSNEQEALYEIQEAIQRIKKGTYGVCETSGKAIPKERLLAVPFARYSVESQTDIEKHRRFTAQRAGVFAEATGDEGKFLEDNSD